MHEMTMVRPLVDTVLRQCEGQGVEEVLSVRLSIGELIDVIEQYVPGLFRFLARGTVAENAELAIERVPVTARCNECCNIFPVDVKSRDTWRCPRCGARNYRMFSGREFRIDSIEVRYSTEEALAEAV